MKKYAVIYSSKTHNTEKLAEIIYHAIPDESKVLIRAAGDMDSDIADTYFIGFWNNKGTCSFEIFDFLSKLSGKKVALFGTCGMGNSPQYYDYIAHQVSAILPDENQYFGAYLCQGKLSEVIGHKYEALLEEHPEDGQLRKMLDVYETGLTHPDEVDFMNAKEFVINVINRLN